MADDLYAQRLKSLGQAYSDMMSRASIERCNCMVRYKGGSQMPARRDGKLFFTPEGDQIAPPSSFEDMHHSEIARMMKANNEVYLGHIFGAMHP